MNLQLEAQIAFCSLLRYFNHGDFNTFGRICSKVPTLAPSENKFAIGNLFAAAHLAGLIEVSETENSTRWWSSAIAESTCGIDLEKVTAITKRWTEQYVNEITPLVKAFTGSPILLGTISNAKRAQSTASSVYTRDFSKFFPTIHRIEAETTRFEPLSTSNAQRIDWFNPQVCKWQTLLTADQVGTRSLVRIKREFTGSSYCIWAPDINRQIRVLFPEWAFFLACRYQAIPFDSFLRWDSGSAFFRQQAKLPTLLKRLFFAACEEVIVGSEIEFRGLKTDIFQWTKNRIEGRA